MGGAIRHTRARMRRPSPLAFRFRTIQVCPKDVGSVRWHSHARLVGGVQAKGEPVMFANEKPLSRPEITAMISICGLLFIMAFKDLGHLSWAIPAMTLFSLAGLGFLFAALCKSERACTLAVP